MYLPESVQYCIRTLESNGFSSYCVGGCVRDALLGLTPHDYDLCTDAKPEDMCRIFKEHTLVRSGEKHGTIGVVIDNEVYEITTFRTEGSYQDGRHPDWVAFVGDVREDLARRDFTMNAMAYSPREGLVDPWGGQEDLKQGILRCVGNPEIRFQEDALRILRGARFAARFRLRIDPATEMAMFQLADTMEHLARERVFSELCQLLLRANDADILRFAPLITQVIPELAPCVGFAQHSSHHIHDVFTHTACVTGAVEPTLPLRWAALLHDVGKPECFSLDETGEGHFYGHAQKSADIADAVLLRLKAPTALRQEVSDLIKRHMLLLEPDKKLLRRRLSRLGSRQLQDLIRLQQADAMGTGTRTPADGEQFSVLRKLIAEILAEDACLNIKDLAIGGNDLISLGIAPGPQIGRTLQWLLEQVLEERLPNTKQALLDACKEETL